MHQQQLRQAVGRTLRAAAPAPPPGLRAALQARLREEINRDAASFVAPAPAPAPGPAAAGRQSQGPYRIGWMWRWLPLAAAAVLLVVALTTLDRGRPWGSAASAAQPVLAPALVDKFAARHNGCARAVQQISNAVAFPSDLRLMPGSLAAYLGTQPYPQLDLSALGYDFWKAGPCILPGPPAVHMLYRRQGSGSGGADDCLSVWIAVDKGQVAIDPDKPYLAAGADKPHPMIVWRHDGLVYYIIGDSLESVDGAAALLRARG
jgi:hypothetical protein